MRGGERPRRRLLLRQRVLPAALLAACAYVILSEHHPRLRWRQRDPRGEAASSGDRHLPGWDSSVGRRETLDISQLRLQVDSGGGGNGSDGGNDRGGSGGSGIDVDVGNSDAGGGFGGSGHMAWATDQQSAQPAAEAAGSGTQIIGGSGRTDDSAQHVIAAAADGSAAAHTIAALGQEEAPQQRRQEALQQRERLAVLVPYRDRAEQLSVFTRHIRAHLLAQGIPFRIIVAEQLGSGPFNRGALLNVAFLEAEKQEAAYVAVHDVDMLPLEGVDYRLPRSGPGALHLATQPQQFGLRAPHDRYCSGALLVTTQLFRAANGYSNGYWGWGGEDDDFCLRLSRQLAEAGAGGSKLAASAGVALPRAPHGSGQFAATGDHTVAPERKQFQQLNLARLTMWRLAGGSGRCTEGLSDVESAGWGAYAETERQAADVVHIFQELPPEVAPGLVALPSRASLAPPAEGDAAEFAAAEATLRQAQLGQHAKLEALERAQWAPAPAMALYHKTALHQPEAVGLGHGDVTADPADGAELGDAADDAAAADGSTAAGEELLGDMSLAQHTDSTAPQPSSSMNGGGDGSGGRGGGSGKSTNAHRQHRLHDELNAVGVASSGKAAAAGADAANLMHNSSHGGARDQGTTGATDGKGDHGRQDADNGGGGNSSSTSSSGSTDSSSMLHQTRTEQAHSNSGGGGGDVASIGAPGRGQGSDSGATAGSSGFVDGIGRLGSALPTSVGLAGGSDAKISTSVSRSGGVGGGSRNSIAGVEEGGPDEEDNDDLDAGMILGYGDALQAAAATTRGSVVQHLVDDPDWAIVRQQGSISSGTIGDSGKGTSPASNRGAGVSSGGDGGKQTYGRWVNANDIEALSGSGSDGDGRQQEAAGELPGSAAAEGVQRMGAAAQRFWEKRRKRRTVGRDANGGISGYLQNLIVE